MSTEKKDNESGNVQFRTSGNLAEVPEEVIENVEMDEKELRFESSPYSVHPGVIIKEVFLPQTKYHGMTLRALEEEWKKFGVKGTTKSSLERIFSGKKNLTIELANFFEEVLAELEIPADYLLNLQLAWEGLLNDWSGDEFSLTTYKLIYYSDRFEIADDDIVVILDLTINDFYEMKAKRQNLAISGRSYVRAVMFVDVCELLEQIYNNGNIEKQKSWLISPHYDFSSSPLEQMKNGTEGISSVLIHLEKLADPR